MAYGVGLRDRGPRGGAILAALVALALLLLIAFRIGVWYEAQLQREQRAGVAVEVASRGNALTTTINRRLTRLQALHSFVQAEADDANFDTLFDTYAAGLSAGSYGIRNIAVAPAGVVRYVYPEAGNEAVLGYSPLADDRPVVRQDTHKAILTGEIILTGPEALVQGGMGLIARQAVQRDGRYWGLVNLVLDVPLLLADAGVAPLPEMGDEADVTQATLLQFALRDGDGNIFSGPAELFELDPVLAQVQVGDEQWELAGAPVGGWQASLQRALVVYRVAAIAICALLALLVFLSVDRQARLAQAVAQRTRALTSINAQLEQDIAERRRTEEALAEREEQYRGVFESTTDALLIFDLEDGRLVDFNPAAHEMHGYSVDEFRNLRPEQIIDAGYLPIFDRHLETVREGKNYRAQSLNVRKDGSTFPVDVLGVRFTYRGRPHTLSVVRDISEQVEAVRLLEQRVQERTRELRGLLNIGRTLSSTLELEPLLQQILEQMSGVVESAGVAVMRLEGSGDTLRLLAHRSPATVASLPERWLIEEGALDYEVIRKGRTVIISDVDSSEPRPRLWRDHFGDAYRSQVTVMRSLLAAPLLYQERVMGMITFGHNEPGYYNEHHADLALAFGSQAAVAIENARLYEQARSLAALRERQRLARELHDSVSQALYGIALGSRTARTIVERGGFRAEQAAALNEPLDYVLSLAQAALTEMRALIFELRPETLETEGLVAALQRQAEAIRARHDIEVSTAFSPEPALPLPAKEALYRVAQEALNNVVKHAGAQQVQISLNGENGVVSLVVQDDGRGFDAAQSFPGHMGLRSMRERVEGVGGWVEIESGVGRGTRVVVEVGD